MVMRKILTVISALFISGIISGQQAYDCLLKSKALNSSGKTDNAIDILSAELQKNQDSRLLIERAEAYLIKGDYSNAVADYNAANSISHESAEYGLAKVYAMKGDAATSLYHLEMNLKSPFKKSEKDIMLDPAFNKIENRPEWRQFWKNDWFSVFDKSIAEIEYYLSAGKNDEAASVLSELKNNYPGSESVSYAGALLNLSAGKYGEAVKSLSDLLTLNPDNEKYLRTLAKAQTGASNPAGASVTYSKLISMEIPDADLLLLRAECYKKTGETSRTISDIAEYLSYYPENKIALSLAGKMEAASGNNLKALEYFSENLKLHPNDPECYIDRANSYFLSKSWEWAIKDYSMSLDLAPGNSDVWLNKGIALVNTGKTDDACHDFKQSSALGNKKATDYISRYCIK
jgi:tetratricopeptide (TPR) repeat protein